MALSTRTLMKEKMWTRLIRSLPEGINELPSKISYDTFLSLKAVCLRENKLGEHVYTPRFCKGKATIIKETYDGESIEQRMQAE